TLAKAAAPHPNPLPARGERECVRITADATASVHGGLYDGARDTAGAEPAASADLQRLRLAGITTNVHGGRLSERVAPRTNKKPLRNRPAPRSGVGCAIKKETGRH